MPHTRKVPPAGPTPARILILGEAPGSSETAALSPFIGQSGQELTRMLHEAGIDRSTCFITNVCKYQPPGDMDKTWLISQKTKGRALHRPELSGLYPSTEILEGLSELYAEIAECNPNIIIALGKTALWALTGETAITKWRGSLMQSNAACGSRKVIPTFHPAAILRMWAWRFPAVHDLRRCAAESLSPDIPAEDFDFTIRPDYQTVMAFLSRILTQLNAGYRVPLSVDIETTFRHIACIGIAISPSRALCIPLMTIHDPEGYWSADQEIEIILALRSVLMHKRAEVFGQGFWYDAQYLIRDWGIWPNVTDDTMLQHHVCFPGTPMDLGYLSSLYAAHHVYWKDELNDYKSLPVDEEQFWAYNCKDCVKTFEVRQVLSRTIDTLDLRTQYNFQLDLFAPVLKMMLRGVRCDTALKQHMGLDLLDALVPRETSLLNLIGRYVGVQKPTKATANWYKSPKQVQALFYDELGLPVQKHKKTKRPTADDEALHTLATREPLVAPLVDTISEIRSIGVFFNTFVNMALGPDKRIHCTYKIPGTETFRFSSSSDAFGFGTNLQNIPAGGDAE